MRNKRFLSLLLTLVMVASVLLMPVSAANACFEDVPKGAWFYDTVRAAYEQGLMQGYNDTAFGPDDTLTRAMFITILGRMAKVDQSAYAGATGFVDVPAGQWYSSYVKWAREEGVTTGVTATEFAPDSPVTREQMATLIYRYVEGAGITLPKVSNPTAGFKDAAKVSSWARDALELMRVSGIILGTTEGNFNPANNATRAEAATVFVRLNKAINGENIPKVNTWQDYVKPEPEPEPEPEEPELPVVANAIVTNDDIKATAAANGIEYGTTAYDALISINTVYASRIAVTDRSGPLLFMFEGAGANSNPNQRQNCMAVLVMSGKIKYLNRYSSTIPDWPFDASRNGGKAVATMKSGIFNIFKWNHRGYTGLSNSAGFHIYQYPNNAVRFSAPTNFYNSYSTDINIHRRYSDALLSNRVSSLGCLLIGRAGTGPNDDYAQFVKALGYPTYTSGSFTYWKTTQDVKGKVIIDRSFGTAWLKSVGYTDAGIKALNGG